MRCYRRAEAGFARLGSLTAVFFDAFAVLVCAEVTIHSRLPSRVSDTAECQVKFVPRV